MCMVFMCLQIEKLLSTADFGPPEEEETSSENDSRWVLLNQNCTSVRFRLSAK